MRRFYQTIIKHPKSIITVFVLSALVCLFLQNRVSVNYDMTDYLPAGSPSTIALDKMESEFEGGIPNARVMVRDVSVAEALEYKERLAACEGVASVTWLDDSVNIR